MQICIFCVVGKFFIGVCLHHVDRPPVVYVAISGCRKRMYVGMDAFQLVFFIQSKCIRATFNNSALLLFKKNINICIFMRVL